MKKTTNLEKTSRFISTCAIVSMLFLFVNCETEDIVTDGDLPQSAQQFLTAHFPEETIAQVVKDKEWNSTQYEVILSNAANLDFNKQGNCTSMESHDIPLPNSAIPAPILEYLEKEYSNAAIVEWDLDEKGQVVELDNGLEFLFDQEGNFLRFDD